MAHCSNYFGMIRSVLSCWLCVGGRLSLIGGCTLLAE